MIQIPMSHHLSPATRAGVHLTAKRIVGIPFRQEIERAWSFTEEEFWSYQQQRFAVVYSRARQEIPHYRNNADRYPSLLTGDLIAQMSSLPVLEKATVKADISAFRITQERRLTSYHTTSGTSGSPIRLAATLPERAFNQAALESWYQRICGKRNPRTLYLSGFMTPSAEDVIPFWTDRVTGDTFLSIYSMNQQNLPVVRDLLAKLDPELIYGYASAVHQLALLLSEEPASGSPRRVAVVTSEVLQPDWRETIEGSIARQVFDLYSSQEGSHAVYQCAFGRLHINPLIGIVEIVDKDGNSVPRGQEGDVVVTSLRRRSMPLIRYRLGDVASSTGYHSGCKCGVGWPTIGAVQGRSEDLVRTRDGRNIGYLCFHATKNLSGIKEAQLVQQGYEDFLFRIVRSETERYELDYVETAIRSEIARRMQARINLRFEYLPAVPRGANGKFKAVTVEPFA